MDNCPVFVACQYPPPLFLIDPISTALATRWVPCFRGTEPLRRRRWSDQREWHFAGQALRPPWPDHRRLCPSRFRSRVASIGGVTLSERSVGRR
jgi:hypothetical protein